MNIEKAVERQHQFFQTGRTKDYAFRYTALLKLKVSIKKYEKELTKALQKDLRKSETEAYMTEIGLTLSELEYNLRHLRKWMKPKHIKTPFAQFPSHSFSISEPYGVTLIMAPWNYPVLLCLDPVIASIAAGNCVILKTSGYAPAASKVLARMLGEIYPAKYVCVVEGGREENSRLLDCRFDKIFFTGSPSVGQLVLEKAAAHITPVTLELGGKSPCIVDRTANLKLAARRIAFGKILNAGQTCVAPDYLLIHKDVKETFLAYYEKEIYRMLGENPLANPDYPKIINKRHYKRIQKLLTEGNIRMGGYGERESLQIMPTVIDGITLDSPIMKEEIFGPLLPVLTYTDRKEVLQIINHFEKPLACYLFTEDSNFMRWTLKNISYGGGCINDTVIHLATSNMGFGGVGGSGMGSYHGKDGFDCFSHRKNVVEKATWLDLSMRYQPYYNWKNKIIRKFMK